MNALWLSPFHVDCTKLNFIWTCNVNIELSHTRSDFYSENKLFFWQWWRWILFIMTCCNAYFICVYLRIFFFVIYMHCMLAHRYRPHNKQCINKHIWWNHADFFRFFAVTVKNSISFTKKHTQTYNFAFDSVYRFSEKLISLFLSCLSQTIVLFRVCVNRYLFVHVSFVIPLVAALLYSQWYAGKFNYMLKWCAEYCVNHSRSIRLGCL